MVSLIVKNALKSSVIAVLGSVFSVGALSAETLSDALVSAYKNSGLLVQNRALLRAADEGVAQTIAALRPIVGYSLGSTYSSLTDDVSTNFGISANILLHDFGNSKIKTDLAKENVLSLREALVGVEQDVLLRAVVAYVGVQRDASIVSLRENNQRVITQELRAAKDRFDLGEITRTDVSASQARLANAKANVAAAQGSLAQSREEYRAAVGSYPGQLAPLPHTPATAKSLAAAQAVARSRHPDMLQAQRAVVIADLNVAASQAAIRPALRGNASVSLNDAGTDTETIGVTLSGPIYQGGQLAASNRAAAAQRDASRAVLHLTQLSIDQNVANGWYDLQVANAQVQARDEEIQASKVAFEGTREEASLGARTALDVLDAEQEFLDARTNKISAEASRYIAIYSLLESMGLLTADHLGLGLVSYDPTAYYNAVQNAPAYKVSPQGKKLDSLLKSLGKN